jgi:MFS superfamily sulfate permease-like transporter
MEHKTPDKPYYLYLSEDVSFLNKAALMRTFNNVPDGCKLIVDASRTKHMHPDIMELIEDFRANADARGITFKLKGIDESPDWDSEHRFHHLVLHGVAPENKKKPV